MSLDKVESSNPNLTAAHAGASAGKTGHLQPNTSNAPDAEEGCFAFSRLASHIRVLSKLGEKPASKNLRLERTSYRDMSEMVRIRTKDGLKRYELGQMATLAELQAKIACELGIPPNAQKLSLQV